MITIDLTPAEAMVLLDPQAKQGREAFKVSLMWLLAQHHLKATEIPARWFKRRTTQLRRGPQAGAALPPDLKSVMMTVQASGTGFMDDIVKEAHKRFGDKLLGYQNDCIYPSLLGRGLLRRTETTHFMLFTRQTYDHTSEGRELCRRIEAMFQDARRIPAFLDHSPAQAAALALSLGGLILLMPELRPHLEEIASVVRRSATTDSSSGGSSGGESLSSDTSVSDRKGKSADEQTSAERDEFHFDFANLDFGDIDNLDSSLSALDASFDSSADSGSGGDGGGDGGGGGGD